MSILIARADVGAHTPLMNNAIKGTANKAAAVKAVLEGTESAIADYGWDTNEAREQALRETAGEFGVTYEAVCKAFSDHEVATA
jgi:hypothetical protein